MISKRGVRYRWLTAALGALLPATDAMAATAANSVELLYILGIPVDFLLFALILLGVAVFHHHTFRVAMTGSPPSSPTS